MKNFLAIALLILCITAKKHHKPATGEEVQTNPMRQCLYDKCGDHAINCMQDDACNETFDICIKTHGPDMKIDLFVECTANNKVASAFVDCMKTNCLSFAPIMRFFNKRK
ncbi:unnamed protein product [Paramecium sonneborni]|uniref:Uncharacterized protein n=1 Tax=Paramecium sonneborni TaxID=65129 RepID=A0A8S1QTT0_9CILI|nr:unnamed protein product [Paramecium sonneborni]